MKIKTKLVLSVGLLFGMISLLTILSVIHIKQLSGDTRNILADNYKTIDYCRRMLNLLNKDLSTPKLQQEFQINLKQQQSNITEVGEKELTLEMTLDVNRMWQNPSDSSIQKKVHSDITNIILLNMQAIQRKSSVATKTADRAILWIAATGTICFLIAFGLLVNLPSNIADPIKALTESIKQIAAKNYSQRVHFKNHTEFGELSESFNTMAKKLEEYSNSDMAKLLMEKRRIETLINNMNDAVIGLDDQQKVLFINDVALKITGLEKEETIGTSIDFIAEKNDLVKKLAEGLTEKKVGKVKTPPVKIYANNKESYFDRELIPIEIIPTGEHKGRHVGDVIILQNVTTYKELEFAKTNFIATVSHELKTPISSINMGLQLLENKRTGTLNDEQTGLVSGIHEDIGRLLKITGELLNMAQVESGAIQISIVPSEVKTIVNYAINATKVTAEQKQISFQIDMPEDLPQVLADSEKTAWVLTNLLSNAIRYSHEHSSIFINISEEDHKIRFSVKDTGQGIAPQYIDKIFDRYFRIPGAKKEGTGLGLSISKEFIEAQGGEIFVNSELGAGTTFTFTLDSLQIGDR